MISGPPTESRHVLRVRRKVTRAAQASAETLHQIIRFGASPASIGPESLFQCLAQHRGLRDSPVAGHTLEARIELVGDLASYRGHPRKGNTNSRNQQYQTGATGQPGRSRPSTSGAPGWRISPSLLCTAPSIANGGTGSP